MTADISRYSLRPKQKFTGVVQQQGRLPLDADANEASDLADLMLRNTVADVICAKGSPDDGFRIADPAVAQNNGLNLSIAAGSFYLGGARCVTDDATYREQRDWLTFPLDNAGPALPAAGSNRTDLVWLSAWEQVVTATEDSELLEQALGGPDTTARRRLMCRVQVLEDVPNNCADAVDQLVAERFAGGRLDDERCSIASDALLTIGFTQLEPLEDLCRPSAQAGFLGARNETFRIQVSTPGRFVWGRDNAAPLYRVQVANDDSGNPRRLVFLNQPRDEFGWPLAGMTVELLRWGALLDNHEKAAEPNGLLLRVETGYDPADEAILVAADVPNAWRQWLAALPPDPTLNPRDDANVNRFFFLRVWTGSVDGNAVDHDMDVGNAVPLGETGMTATFSDNGLAGDYWIVSARPNTPTTVTPWSLLEGASPAGPLRLIAPLALLPWTGPAPGTPIDCRHRFRPLCRVGGCCVITVGDGRHSFGDVRSIQEAVNRMPTEGGEICIHPGRYEEHVVIRDARNITLTGCGVNTQWHGDAGRADPLLTIRNSANITVRRLAMTGAGAECIVAQDVPADRLIGGPRMANLMLEQLRFTAADFGAVAGFGGEGYTIRDCRITLERLSVGLNDASDIGRAAAIFLAGDDLTVERCRIEAARIRDRLRLPVGGIHIGGGSERVRLRDNLILGGNGHGITLGSVQYVPPDDGNGDFLGPNSLTAANRPRQRYTTDPVIAAREGGTYYGHLLVVDPRGCITITGRPPRDEDLPEGTPNVPESSGLVRDVEIRGNEIARMGYSGISAHVFAGLGGDASSFGDAVAVESIEIVENRIHGCMLNEIGTSTPIFRLFTGWGGIALSICSDATIRDNVIASNGIDSAEAIVGVFIAVAEDVKIERNRIEQNGAHAREDLVLNPGRRGGVVIGITIGGLSSYGEQTDKQRSADRPALVVTGNMVDAPSGRALKAIALGPCIVLDNRLTGAGRSAFASNVFASLVAAGVSFSQLRGQLFDPKEQIDLGDFLFLELLADVLGGDVVNIISLTVAEDLVSPGSSRQPTYTPQRLRGGEMMFNNNQISLQRHSPQLAVNVSAVLLIGLDDISFCDNQAEVENDVVAVLTNCLIFGASIRVNSNRLQERIGGAFLSAISYGVMNATSFNQTTHCILAGGVGSGRVVEGNRTVIELFSPRACNRIGEISVGISRRQTMMLGIPVDGRS